MRALYPKRLVSALPVADEGFTMTACPKNPPLRDRKYLDWLRHQPCILSGQHGNDNEAVDPMHIGTAGKGIKSGDDEVLPVLHSLHTEGHTHGEMSLFRRRLPDMVLRAALRALGREIYAEWKRGA